MFGLLEVIRMSQVDGWYCECFRLTAILSLSSGYYHVRAEDLLEIIILLLEDICSDRDRAICRCNGIRNQTQIGISCQSLLEG